MARTVLTFDGLNLNDGTVYAWLPGVELGARQKSWSERKSYTGAVAQYNMSEAASIPMKFPLVVQGTSLPDLDAKVQAINTKIDGCSSASPKNLVFAGMTYQITTTPRVSYVLDEAAISLFRAALDLVPNRNPYSNLIALRSVSLAGVENVIYIGDSLTAGYYATTEALSFRKLLDAWLATLGIAAGTEAYGVGGADSGFASVPVALAGFAAENADLAFIELGTNDLSGSQHTPWAPTPLPEFAANMRAISSAVRTHNPGCVMVYLTNWGQADAEWPQYDAVLRWIADEFGGVVVDLYAVYHDNDANYLPAGSATWLEPVTGSDGWHPNDNGHREISRITQVALLSGWPAGWTRRGERSNFIPNPRLVGQGQPATNYCTNPSFELDTNADGSADGVTDYKTCIGTPVYSRVAGRLGGYAQRMQYTGVAGDAGKVIVPSVVMPISGTFAAADPNTESVYAKGAASGCTVRLVVYEQKDDGSYVYEDYSGYFAPTGDWQRVSKSKAALEALTTKVKACFLVEGVDEGDTIDLIYDDALSEKSAVLTPYFDGSTTGCSWSGTPNASTSKSDLPSFWNDVSTGHGTKICSVVADGDAFYQQTVYTVHADDLTGTGHNVCFYLDHSIVGQFAEADPATIALEYQFVVSNVRSCSGGVCSLWTQDFGAGGDSAMAPAGAWTPVSKSIAALPAGVTSLAAYVTASILNATGVAGDTITLRWRHPILSKTPAAVPFFHGDSTPDDRWLDDNYARRYLATVASPGVYTLLADTDWRGTKMETALVPVTAGLSYRASAHVEITACVAGTFSAVIEWHDADGILFSSSTIGARSVVGTETMRGAVTAPVGATHALVRLRWGSDIGAGLAEGACAATVSDIYLRDV